MNISQLVMGSIFTIGGLVLTIVALVSELWVLIYGLPLLVIGIVILFNKREDKIEEIKKSGGKKRK